MKTNNIFLHLILLSFSLFTSCTDDEIVKGRGEGTGMCFTLSSLGEEIINSRAVNDNTLNDVYVLLLNTDTPPKLTQIIKATTTDEKMYFANVPEDITSGSFYVAANVGSIDNTWIGKEIEEVKKGIKTTLRTAQIDGEDCIVESPKFPPMLSLTSTNYTGVSGDYGTITLQRTIAKVVVTDGSGNARYKMQGFNAGNAAKTSYLFPESPLSKDVAHYAGLSDVTYSLDFMIGIPAANTKTAELYMYETSKEAKPIAIVKGEYNGVVGYHRLNIWDRKTEYYDINRNYIYNISIKHIYTTGYATAREAIDHPASNRDIDVDITVDDGVSRDIVSNGEYYLGLSNTKCILYSIEDTTDMVVATFTTGGTNPPASSFSCKETESTDANKKMSVIEDKTDNIHQLKVTLPKEVIKGEITIRTGELAQKIEIERKIDYIPIGGAYLIGEGYVSGQVNKNSDSKDWIRFSNIQDPDITKGVKEYMLQGGVSNKLYMVFANNLIMQEKPQGQTARSAEVILAKANDEGHTKLIVSQPAYDIFKPNINPRIENPYVGAFWRANQTGERVIKMEVTNKDGVIHGGIVSWDAIVAIGSDWTGLALGGSSDPAIYTSNPAIWSKSNNFDTTYKVLNPKSSIGSKLADDGCVLFRIGLNNSIGAKEHRYGLILVNLYNSLGEKVNTYRIFTRQGDASDYLFRPSDAGYNNWGSGTAIPRPKAVKIAAFNLTSAQLGTGGTIYDLHSLADLDYLPGELARGFNRDRFTQFPSQTGYFFIWNIAKNVDTGKTKDNATHMRAIHPTNNSGLTEDLFKLEGSSFGTYFTIIPTYYNPEGDPCPYGYRYPSIGEVVPGGTTDTQTKKSELIQSILYDPSISNNPETMADYTLWGYYADGFYDRLPIATDRTKRVVRKDNIKNASGNDIGYIGQVIINPFNLASIFFPAAGYLTPFNLNGPGEWYFIAASERSQTTGAESNTPISFNATPTKFQMFGSQAGGNFPKNVRCVRDEKLGADTSL